MSDTPFRIERLDHLVLRTPDVARLEAFYERLGGKVARRLEGMGMVQMRVGTSMVDLVPSEAADAEGDARNLDHFALRIEPFDEEAILAFCREHDIEVQTHPHALLGADGFGPAVYLRDPDGNRVELKGPPERPAPDDPRERSARDDPAA